MRYFTFIDWSLKRRVERNVLEYVEGQEGSAQFFSNHVNLRSHHFSNNASLTRSLLVSCNGLRHYLFSELLARLVQWWEHSLPINVARVEIPVPTPYVIVFVVGSFFLPWEVFLQLPRFSNLNSNLIKNGRRRIIEHNVDVLNH